MTIPIHTLGTRIALIPVAQGGGGDLSLINDGVKPVVDDPSDPYSTIMYDSFHNNPEIAEQFTQDWIGYTFPKIYDFHKVVFQEGRHFVDGGWFETLTVQIRKNGVWGVVDGLVISPVYPAIDNSVWYETYELAFHPRIGDAIRIIGKPGGSMHFISVAELEVFGLVFVPPGLSPGVTFQEPPYAGPFTNPPFDPNIYAIQDNPRNDEVRWCTPCRRPVVVDERPGFMHKHFEQVEESTE